MESEFIKLLHNIDPKDPEDSYPLKKLKRVVMKHLIHRTKSTVSMRKTVKP